MVIYARGGSEGTAVEAESRTRIRQSGEKLSPVPSYTAPESQSLSMNTAFSVCCACVRALDCAFMCA